MGAGVVVVFCIVQLVTNISKPSLSSNFLLKSSLRDDFNKKSLDRDGFVLHVALILGHNTCYFYYKCNFNNLLDPGWFEVPKLYFRYTVKPVYKGHLLLKPTGQSRQVIAKSRWKKCKKLQKELFAFFPTCF